MSDSAIHSVVSEGQHLLGKNAGMAVSKGGLTLLNDGHAVTHSLHGTLAAVNEVGAKWGLSGGAAVMGGLGGMLTMGLVGVISAAVAQMDYLHEITKIKDTYRHEIAAQKGKNLKAVNSDDLYEMANGNPEKGIEGNKVIADEIAKKKKERTVGVLLSAGATATSFGVLASILGNPLTHKALYTVAETAAASIGLPGAGGALFLIGEVIVGMGIYNAVKQPLHWVSHKLLGLDKETTHDKIASLQFELVKGKGISQEQVLDVYVSANKDLGELVKNQYGKAYEDMDYPERQRVTAEISKLVPLEQLTNDINARRYDVGELAFAVEGKSSGYSPNTETQHHSWMEGMASKMLAMFDLKKRPQQQAAVNTQAATQESWHPAQEQTGKKTFVERYAGGSKASSLGHVERLDQARENPAIGTQLA